MNAKEFAHELEKAASFIRQQQAEIETYKLELYDEVILRREQQTEIEALKAAKIRTYNNGVEDGRKPDTNNEPVAWMHQNPDYAISKHQSLEYNIPLYTHPVKELTEWEMKECWEEATEGREHFCSQYFDFAQLILRKAQK